MKKLTVLVMVLLLASACAGTGTDSTAAPEVLDTPSVSLSTQPSAAVDLSPEIVPSPSPSPAPTPTPEPTPTPPASLREVLTDSIAVWMDGTAIEGLLCEGAVLLNAADLTEVYPWLQWEGDGCVWRFTDESGFTRRVYCGPAERFSGTGGVLFEGQSREYWLNAEWVAGQFGMQYCLDTEWNAAYLTAHNWLGADALNGCALPVLMYHEVGDDLWGLTSLFVSPSNLRAQLQYLYDNGYDPIFFSDLSHLSDYDKPVLLTFDDGYIGNYTELFPLLKEFHMKATVFVITGLLGQEHYITAEQAKEMSDSGLVDIQSHTVDHYELASLSGEDQYYQLKQSWLEIARITKKIPYVLAYPSGSHNDTTVDIGQYYYTYGLKMNGGIWYPNHDNFYVDRLYVSRSTTLDQYAALLK